MKCQNSSISAIRSTDMRTAWASVATPKAFLARRSARSLIKKDFRFNGACLGIGTSTTKPEWTYAHSNQRRHTCKVDGGSILTGSRSGRLAAPQNGDPRVQVQKPAVNLAELLVDLVAEALDLFIQHAESFGDYLDL